MTEKVQLTGRSLRDTLLLVGSSEAFTKRVFLWTLPIGLFVAVFMMAIALAHRGGAGSLLD